MMDVLSPLNVNSLAPRVFPRRAETSLALDCHVFSPSAQGRLFPPALYRALRLIL
jgi:hypothetical protein